MKKIAKLLKGYKRICFLDFEGTQYSHEMIAFGAVLAILDKEGRIKTHKKPIKFYVKAKNNIGKFVEDLTGINQHMLDRVGIPFSRAVTEIKKYCGLAFSRCAFMTFGNHDMKIFNSSISHNLDTPTDITSVIHKNFVDYQAFISDFIKNSDGNPYSLENYLRVFNVDFNGTTHDPKDDAYNLMLLYDNFLRNPEIVLDEYLKVLGGVRHLPTPIKVAAEKLSRGEDMSAAEFKEIARGDLK